MIFMTKWLDNPHCDVVSKCGLTFGVPLWRCMDELDSPDVATGRQTPHKTPIQIQINTYYFPNCSRSLRGRHFPGHVLSDGGLTRWTDSPVRDALRVCFRFLIYFYKDSLKHWVIQNLHAENKPWRLVWLKVIFVQHQNLQTLSRTIINFDNL